MREFHFRGCLLVMALVLYGCTVAQNRPVNSTIEPQQVTLSKAEHDAILGKVSSLKERNDELRKDVARLQKELEEVRAGKNLPLVLFGGESIYEVEAAAVMDYRELLRFRSLDDATFRAAMEHGGVEHDYALLALLRQIDMSPADRMITRRELLNFKGKVESGL